MPIGSITRGTTGTNRLRRIDRWIAQLPALRDSPTPLVVDLGYGASATTVLELHQRLSRVRADVEVIGVEIDPARVTLAQLSNRPGVSFRLGGFEVPLPAGRSATVIRAFNVLRQYDESEVSGAWKLLVSRLEPGGVLVEGTCNEVGRVASWVDVTAAGPRSLTLSLRLADLTASGAKGPAVVAERLPKVLIHRNIAGEAIHEFLVEIDRHWKLNSALSVYAASQRWIATARGLKADGWPIVNGPARWKLGELTVAWEAVAPSGYRW